MKKCRETVIIELLKDWYNSLDNNTIDKKFLKEKYISKLDEIINDCSTSGDNLLMTQKECLYFYKSDGKSILNLIPTLKNTGSSSDFIEGLKFAVDVFLSRDEF